MDALPSYGDIKDVLKDVADLFKKSMTIEEREKVMKFREMCLALAEANLELKEKNKELEKALRIKAALQFKPPFYFLDSDTEPYCPRCWEKDNYAIHLEPEVKGNFHYARVCPECKAEYKTRDFVAYAQIIRPPSNPYRGI
jgi:hypothetical protein